MNAKRIALLLSVLLVFSLFLTACDSSPSASPPSGETPSANNPDGMEWPTDNDHPVATVKSTPAGAIDFSDGNTDFLAFNLAPGDADPSELSVITHEGLSALKVEIMEDKNPYLGIDVSSLFGDKVADIRKIEMQIWTEHPDGTFYATSGYLEVYTGESNAKAEYLWAVSMEKNNPSTLTAELAADAAFVPDAKNILILRKATNGDSAVGKGDHAANIIIDYIACYDASGNVIPADTSASFAAPKGFGSADMSFLYEIADEVKLGFTDDGKNGTSSGWGQAGALDKEGILADYMDMFQPGAVITVGYSAEKAPEIVFQCWDAPDGVESWAKVAPFMTNASGNIAQYRYEDWVESFGTDDFDTYLDRLYIGDRNVQTDIKSFSIGQRVNEIEYKSVLIGDDGFIDLTPMNNHANKGVSPGGWKQCFRMDTSNSDQYPPDFNPGWITEGCYVVAYYESEKATQFIFQRFAVEGAAPQIWGSLTGTSRGAEFGGYVTPEVTEDGVRVSRPGVDMVEYEAIMDKWVSEGGDVSTFAEELGAFWIQDDGAEYSLNKVILYTPTPNP